MVASPAGSGATLLLLEAGVAVTAAKYEGDANAFEDGEMMENDAELPPAFIGLLGAAFTNEGTSAGPPTVLEGSSGM